jgi:hypothetical protein
MLFAMEPVLSTAIELKEILAELSQLEPIFHWPPPEMTRANLERMTVEDFWEVGASGRRFARESVFGVLEQRRSAPQPNIWEITDIHCRKLPAKSTCSPTRCFRTTRGSRGERRSGRGRRKAGRLSTTREPLYRTLEAKGPSLN